LISLFSHALWALLFQHGPPNVRLQPRRLMIFIGRRRLQAVLGGLSIPGSAAYNPFLDWTSEVVTGRAAPTGGPMQSIASSR